MDSLLHNAAEAPIKYVVTGGTGTGKSSYLLNLLSNASDEANWLLIPYDPLITANSHTLPETISWWLQKAGASNRDGQAYRQILFLVDDFDRLSLDEQKLLASELAGSNYVVTARSSSAHLHPTNELKIASPDESLARALLTNDQQTRKSLDELGVYCGTDSVFQQYFRWPLLLEGYRKTINTNHGNNFPRGKRRLAKHFFIFSRVKAILLNSRGHS